MAKNLLQDMVKIKREKQLGRSAVSNPVQGESVFVPKETRTLLPSQKQNKKTGTRYAFWMVAGGCLVFFLFALSYLFSRATIVINPKIDNLALNEDFSADLDGGEDTLSFDLVVLSGEESKAMQAGEERDVSEKASGVVVLYNAFSTSPQRLDINTRLEGSNDKIYKTEKAITIPGITKEGKPGSVEVKVFGAEAGAEYNSAPLDFKIFGFKGTPKYGKFYGRSKTSLAGGFIGKSFFVSESQKSVVVNELQSSLQAKLLKKATDQIPSGFILFKDASFLVPAEDGAVAGQTEDKKSFTLKGTLYGILFNEKKLTEKIAKDEIEKHGGSEVLIANIRELKFSLTHKDSASLGDMKSIKFNLSGDAKIIYKVDTDKLARDLLGKSKKEFNQTLLQYPYIDSANLSISPFWGNSIPDKIKKIKITVNYPE